MDAAILISCLSLAVSVAGLLWNRHMWRAQRKTDVRVMAWHNAMGLDIYEVAPEALQAEHVIALRVFNHGEQQEYVEWTGVETAAGEPLADDRPTAGKIVDTPPPVPRAVPPRGQLATQFKVPAAATAEGFVGYAVLGTGERIYSAPARPDPHMSDIHDEILGILVDLESEDNA